ncbi:ribonuclease E [Roseibium sp. TrichSKD4]|nr:ribonuclease E [Roseibium sp. TrichSKD4]
MANKMLIDAAHPEETRVVVVRGNRVEEFDFEAANRKQLRGNIYLAKVTRVEPSLQAAFVEYGGNRHGFLAFSEIHPDYYQIPVADRQALLEAEAAEREQDDAADSDEKPKRRRRSRAARNETKEDVVASSDDELDESTSEETTEDGEAAEASETTGVLDDEQLTASNDASENNEEPSAEQNADSESDPAVDAKDAATDEADAFEARSDADDDEDATEADTEEDDDAPVRARSRRRRRDADDENSDDEDSVESVGAEDAMEEVPERRQAPRRHYKIQEVIKRRQIILVQVVKEERGNKGAALTTYLSLAGRYSVLMPNTARGGGISRKITQPTDRKRLKKIASELDVPEGMGVILRTAGASRTKAEIKRDFEYLMRLWETVRDLTLQSSAPNLVYEEGSLIKRSIRDLYNKDINQVLVAGEEGYREAKDFMRMLMPSHAKNVQPYRDPSPLFIRFGVEPQLDAMFSPQVTMKSGGYIVINQTEALVSIDVNSGKSTKEHNIEDTALQTNLEAAEEVARQLRLRDLAGLVVIDFIDMEENKNNRNVERKLKECLKNDRARIQVGRISHFGLLEMSRQRLRTGVLESSTTPCPHCNGTGMIRSVESVALHVLRSVEDNLLKGATHNLILRTSTTVALYVLNQKRAHLVELEGRFAVEIEVQADVMVNGQHYMLDRGELVDRDRFPAPVVQYVQPDTIDLIEDEDEPEEEVQETSSDEADQDGDRDRKRRRRREGAAGSW